jgi:hypothetical protein
LLDGAPIQLEGELRGALPDHPGAGGDPVGLVIAYQGQRARRERACLVSVGLVQELRQQQKCSRIVRRPVEGLAALGDRLASPTSLPKALHLPQSRTREEC